MKECRKFRFSRPEIEDEGIQKKLWEASESTVMALEKEGAMRRAVEKKDEENKKAKEEKAKAKEESKKTKEESVKARLVELETEADGKTKEKDGAKASRKERKAAKGN